MAGKNFDAFKQRIEQEFMQHPVVTRNAYTAWFAHGEMPIEHVRHFTVQFSVFSNQFLLAALNRVINADSLEAARESKQILMNELGVIYNKDGSIDGGRFRFHAAHLEWLLRFGEPLGLTFNDLGKRRHGTPSTLFFCDELFTLYGSDDYNEAMGAAFAVENWAAAGFWKELISGLERIKGEKIPNLPLSFFTWHDRLEEQHKDHVWEELRQCYDSPKFQEEPFIRAGVRMLDGVKAFWDGLDDDRVKTGDRLKRAS
jgi:pyrroloquinoline quinone (PQQ) biosynthesis protein C